MNTFRHPEHTSAPVQDIDLQQKSADTAVESFAPIREAMRDPVGYIGTHRYALWLLYLPAYLLYFGMLQMRAVPAEAVHIIETPLDRMIPTIPAFFVPYAIWWLLFPGALVFFLFYGTRRDFLKLCFILFGGYTICMVVYTVWPNGLALRESLTGSDLFSLGVQWLRAAVQLYPSAHEESRDDHRGADLHRDALHPPALDHRRHSRLRHELGAVFRLEIGGRSEGFQRIIWNGWSGYTQKGISYTQF